MNLSILGSMLIQSQNVLHHIYPSFAVHLFTMAYYNSVSKSIYVNTSLYMSIGGLLGGRIVPGLRKRFSYRVLILFSLFINALACFGQSLISGYLSHFLVFFAIGVNHNFLYYLCNHIGIISDLSFKIFYYSDISFSSILFLLFHSSDSRKRKSNTHQDTTQ